MILLRFWCNRVPFPSYFPSMSHLPMRNQGSLFPSPFPSPSLCRCELICFSLINYSNEKDKTDDNSTSQWMIEIWISFKQIFWTFYQQHNYLFWALEYGSLFQNGKKNKWGIMGLKRLTWFQHTIPSLSGKKTFSRFRTGYCTAISFAIVRLWVIGGLELAFDAAEFIPNVEVEPEPEPDPVSVAEVSSDSLQGLRQHAVTESTVEIGRASCRERVSSPV